MEELKGSYLFAIQSVVHTPISMALPGCLLELQNLGSYLRPGVQNRKNLFDLDGVCYKGLPVWCGLRVGQVWTSIQCPYLPWKNFSDF